jgi:hypothetical protein
MKQYGRVLRTIGGDKNPEWKFIDHDQDTIRLQLVRDKDRYILVDKEPFGYSPMRFQNLRKNCLGKLAR